MRAVNLVPSDVQRSGRVRLPKLAVPTYALLGLLVAGLVMTTLYVMASNDLASRQAKIADLQSQVNQAQGQAAQLSSYAQFASLAQTRVSTVRGLAATRFDWHAALAGLARIVPANTSLQSLNASVVPGANAGGGGSSTGLRGDEPGPAFEMTGCTATQDDVARLISRLRVMDGVVRVALNSSVKSTTQAAAGAGSVRTGCKPNWPTFSVVVFFQPVSGAGATGATAVSSTSTAATTTGTPASTSSSTPSTGSAK